MHPEIRKIVTYDEEILIEGFRKSEKPWRLFAVAAVIKNPWAGKFVEDLKPEIQAYGPILGEMMTKRMLKLAGSGDAIEAYGKAAVVGLNGEIEHASALIHTLDLVIFIAKQLERNHILLLRIQERVPMPLFWCPSWIKTTLADAHTTLQYSLLYLMHPEMMK